MMRLTISRCFNCSRARLVDRVHDRWVCFACKQRVKVHRILDDHTKVAGIHQK